MVTTQDKMNHGDIIPIIFRKWKNGDVIALLPTIPADSVGRYIESYMHIGQHCAADYNFIVNESMPAQESEYAELLAELQAIGYDNLKIYRRKTYAMDKARQYYLDFITFQGHKRMLAIGQWGDKYDKSYAWMKNLSKHDTELANHAKKIISIIDRRIQASQVEKE